MKTTKRNPLSFKTLSLALGLGALPLAVMVTGCVTAPPAQESPSQAMNDQAITERVKQALANDDQKKFSTVGVNTFEGTVQLIGYVHSDDQKRQVEEIARSIQGVSGIDDNITIQG
jgi:hyperosmotically inducible protein